MRVNTTNVRRVLFATAVFTSAMYLMAAGVVEIRKALR